MLNSVIHYIHYLSVIFIGLAMVLSFIVLIHAVKNSKMKNFSTWQFPMLLALFFDGVISFYP
jgi:hypothetical protein